MPDAADSSAQLIGLLSRHAFSLLASAGLLILSATCSSCETSLFSLSTVELNRVRAGAGRIDRAIIRLHADLKGLLPTLLFCNMAVNVLIFALSASVATSLGRVLGPGATLGYSIASLSLVVFFGEVFPKQLAIASSLRVARLTAMPVWVCYRALSKPIAVLNWFVGAFERILGQRAENVRELKEEELRLLVQLSNTDGVISKGEYELIDSIVDLPDVRIRDIMLPRVDAQPLPMDASLDDAMRQARMSRHCKIPVRDEATDEVVGWVDVRDAYSDDCGSRDAAETIQPYVRGFRFFSEHDRADQALERIKGAGGELFAVVDERGQMIGYFTLQDIMDEMLGHFGEHGAAPPDEIREQGGGYVISGRFSVREWRELFDVDAAIPKSATVGGLVVSLLGRVPRQGDTVMLDNMEMTVLSTHRNRVVEVGLRLVGDGAAATGEGTP